MKLTNEMVTEIYTEYMSGLRKDKKIIWLKKRSIKMFFFSLEGTGKDDLREAVKEDVFNFVKYLNDYERIDGKKNVPKNLARRTKTGIFSDVRLLFSYFYVNGYLLTNVFENTDEIRFKGVEEVRKVFLKDEINKFLDSIETGGFYGLRTRVIFELMYSSGLRLREVIKLDLTDVNLETREALIRCSKFKKDRVVPISEVAEKFLGKYIERTKSIRKDNRAMFIRADGGRIGRDCIEKYQE